MNYSPFRDIISVISDFLYNRKKDYQNKIL
jgi:hypothetical protein